ncbi:hypothetical protein [Arthrobacter sp. FW306-04-A]|uniref:hypothetical protein n=1 Tax=Arthrobacter sp. FW306-04-A TaxID=2879619 RepID=UPI0037C01384|nr:hypothetical protein LFT43_09945 [Arthrobacter sp. FW306-04-A]
MKYSSSRHVPAAYQLRVDGHIDGHWSAWFSDFTLTHESDGTTSLGGFVPDQAALHGLLMKVRDLGLVLISVEVMDPPAKKTAGTVPGSTAESEIGQDAEGDYGAAGAVGPLRKSADRPAPTDEGGEG